MKLYSVTKLAGEKYQLVCEAEVFLVDERTKKRTGASRIESTARITNDVQSLALAIMRHYYGTDAPGEAEAQKKVERFKNAFLAHQNMQPGAKLAISSEVIDRWVNLLN